MPNYTVTWTIDIDEAATPREAAERAWAHARHPDSIANVFDVREEGARESVSVNLDDGAECAQCGADTSGPAVRRCL